MPDQSLCQRLLVCLLLANTHTYGIARKVGFQKMKKSEKSWLPAGHSGKICPGNSIS